MRYSKRYCSTRLSTPRFSMYVISPLACCHDLTLLPAHACGCWRHSSFGRSSTHARAGTNAYASTSDTRRAASLPIRIWATAAEPAPTLDVPASYSPTVAHSRASPDASHPPHEHVRPASAANAAVLLSSPTAASATAGGTASPATSASTSDVQPAHACSPASDAGSASSGCRATSGGLHAWLRRGAEGTCSVGVSRDVVVLIERNMLYRIC